MCKENLHEDKDIKFEHYKDSPRETMKISQIELLKKKLIDIPIFERNKCIEVKYALLIEKRENKKYKNFLEEYIDIIELLFLNDTNKMIVTLYLNYIRKNNENIKLYNLKTFSEEINKYKILFTVEEFKKIQKNIKTKSEKENFIEYLQKLNAIQNDADAKENFIQCEKETKQIKYFNYPIEFLNQELFYYKLYVLLIVQIDSVYKDNDYSDEGKRDYIFNKKKIANIIITENILNNDNIIKNEDKMNLLITIILFDTLNEKNQSVNLNRLFQTEKAEYDKIEEYMNKNKIGEFINFYDKDNKLKGLHLELYEREIIKINSNDICDICVKNLDDFPEHNLIDDNYKYNTFNSIIEKNELTKFIVQIKKFLLMIIKSKVYKEAIIQLFPEYNKYLLDENLKDTEECINHRIKFYPFQNLKSNGFTDKFSMCSYINVFYKLTPPRKEFKSTLRCSSAIEISLREINHINQNLLYFRGNDRKMLLTPKRKNIKGKEGGENLEELFFGKKKELLRMLECLYILNENNYKQSLQDFRKNFMNLYNNSVDYSEKIKFLKNNDTNAIFKEFFDNIKDFKEADFKKNELYFIYTRSINLCLSEYVIYVPKNHCTMGA